MIKRLLIGLLLLSVFSLAGNAVAQVELVELIYESNKIKVVVESRSPISFEYFTNEQTRQFGVMLQGADFYPALTDYFQSIDIDGLSQCIDEITIVPIDENAARFEVLLLEGLVASVYDDTANSPRNFRVIIQFVALDKNTSPCFSDAGRARFPNGGAGAITPVLPPPVVVPDDSEIRRPLNAAQIEDEQRAADDTRTVPEDRGVAPRGDNKISYSAYLAYDFLAHTNKGGFKDDPWLKQEAPNELRAAEARVSGNYGEWDYELALHAMNNSLHELNVSLFRASLAYTGIAPGLKLAAGVLEEPFGGEASNSIDQLPFLERSLTRYLANEYNPGFLVGYDIGDWVNLELGVFGKRSASSEPSSEQSTTGRILMTPYTIGDSALTFGLSVRLWEPVDNIYRIDARPESNIILPLFRINQINVDSVDTNGLNMFMNIGSFAMSAESIVSTLNHSATISPTDVKEVTARSLWASYVFTGEKRRIVNSVLQRVKPSTSFTSSSPGWGAIEAGVRFSEITDDNDQKLSGTTIGVVWYPNSYMQLKANWVFALQAEDPAVINDVDNDADIVEVRFQIQY